MGPLDQKPDQKQRHKIFVGNAAGYDLLIFKRLQSTGLFSHPSPHEVAPATYQIVVFIHHRVPHRDVPHALFVGATVAHFANIDQRQAVTAQQRLARGLAGVPVIPFGTAQVVTGTGRVADVIALTLGASLWLGIPSHRPCSVGPPRSAIPGRVAANPASCRVTHCAKPV